MGGGGDWIAPALAVGLAPFTGGASLIAGAGVMAGQQAAKKAQKAAQDQADQQRRQFDALTADMNRRNQETATVQAADAARRQARKRQLALSAGGTGRQDTILTQGLGGSGPQDTQLKTLLGQ